MKIDVEALSEVLIRLILKAKFTEEESAILSAKVTRALTPGARSEEQRAAVAEKNRAHWERNRVEARFKITFRGSSPVEVDGYAALAKVVKLSETNVRKKIYAGRGSFSGVFKDGDTFKVERLSKASYNKGNS